MVHCIETGKPNVFVKIFVQLKIRLNSWSAERNWLRRSASPGFAI